MSAYLLAGIRQPMDGELTLAAAARDVVTRMVWHGWLRRWGLLESFALPPDPASEPQACLIVRAQGYDAVARLADGWARVSGYRVTVLSIAPRTGNGRTDGGG